MLELWSDGILLLGMEFCGVYICVVVLCGHWGHITFGWVMVGWHDSIMKLSHDGMLTSWPYLAYNGFAWISLLFQRSKEIYVSLQSIELCCDERWCDGEG